MKLVLVPLTRDDCMAFVKLHHRHCERPVGHRFGMGAEYGGKLVGVVMVGRTTARMLHKRTTAEVTRLAVDPAGPKNACSFLYAAARRAWQSMGGLRLVTYNLDEESGASLRADGWKVASEFDGAQWDRTKRPRKDQAVSEKDKRRWEAPMA